MRSYSPLLLIAISYVSACAESEPPAPPATSPTPLAFSPSTPVGTIGGSFSVTPSGSAHYSIPLAMAPGRRGIEPTLKLEYDSSAGTGYLGTGWSLGGLSRITRCTGVPDVDLVERPSIHWDDDDELCLDGQALEPFSAGDQVTYRTYPDHVTKVTRLDPLDDPDGAFEVRTADGMVWTYGGAPEATVPGYGGVPAAWWVRTVRDRFGNQLMFHYDFTPKPSWYEDHRLSRITYTSWQSGSQLLNPERSVELVYGTRPAVEHLEAYDHGAKTVNTMRLLRIDNVVSHQLVRSYVFGYADGTIKATERSVLQELTTCDGAGACMPPMRFEYSTAGVGRYQHEWDTYPYSRDPDSPDAAIAPVPLDANIDGRRDMLVRTGDAYRLFRAVDTGAAEFEPEELMFPVAAGHGLRVGDVDGDGRSDIIEVSTGGIIVHYAGHLGFYNTVQQVAELEGGVAGYLDFAVFDYDGDGRDDLYACRLPMPEGECQPDEDDEVCDPQPEDCEFEDGEAECDTEGCEPAVNCESETTQATWHRINVRTNRNEDTGIECAQDCTYTGGCDRRASWIVLDHDHDGVDELLQIVDTGTSELLRSRELGTDPLGPYDLDPDDDLPPYHPDYEYLAIHGSDESGDYELVSTGLPPDAFQRYNAGAGHDKIYDVNGDGHDDVVRFEPHNASEWMAYYRACTDEAPAFSGARAVAYISTGKGFVKTPIVEFDAWDDLCTEWKRSVAADWTGDGRIDLVFPHDNGDDTADLWVAKSRYPEPSETAPTQIGELSRADMPLVSVDTAGTGFGIAFWHGNAGEEDGSWHLLFRNATPDLLVGITDGHGATTEIEYSTLADDDVYRPGLSGAEQRGVCDARSVVVAVREPEGPVDRETVYSYYDLAVDVEHRRSLGFTSRTSATRAGPDWLSRTLTEYAKDLVDPGTGLHLFASVPERTTTWTSLWDTGQQAIERTSYAHALQVSDERVYPHVASTIQQRWDVAAVCDPRDGDGCANPASLPAPFATRIHVESDWDDLGYALHVVDSDGELTTTQTIDYDHDLATWLVGQPRRVDITSSAVGDDQHRVVEYTYYQDTGALETMRISDGGLTSERSAYYEYTRTGNVQLVEADGRDAEQRNTKLEYDAVEEIFPIVVEDANARASTVTWYPGLGLPQAIADPNGVTVTVTRDGFGRPTRQVRSAPGKPSDGADKLFAYERMDDVLTPTAPSRMRVRSVTNGGADETIELDRHGREEQRRWRGLNGEQRYVELDYDTAGRVTRQTLPQVVGLNPTGSETYAYDALGRIATYTPATGGATEMSYAGRTTTVTDPRGFVWRRDVDLGGRPKSVTDPYGTTVCYYSGAFGAPIGVGVNNGRCFDAPPLIAPVPTKDAYVTRTTFDAYGRVTRLVDPNVGTRRYSYNGFGDVLTSTDAADNVTTFVRDLLGRPTSATDADGETTWEWDDAVAGGKYGLLHASTSPYGVEHEFVYDVFARLTHDVATVDGESFTTSVQYDGFARPYKIKYPPGPGATPFGTTTQYDAFGHATKLVDSATGTEYWRLVATTPAEQLAQERFGNGLVSARTYAGGRLQTIQTGTAGSPASIQNLAYGYDASGNLIDRDDLRALQYEHFDYDKVDRLWRGVETKRIGAIEVPAGDWAIVYNRLGAITTKSDVGEYTYGDPAHPLALTAAGGATHEYDDNGSLVVRNATAITYTPYFAPRELDGPAVDETRDYDASGEVMRRREAWAGGSRTTVIAGGFRRITELAGMVPSVSYEYLVTAGGRTIARLRRAPGFGGTVTTVRYVHDDHVGSPDAMTTEAGAIAEDASFDPWGKPRNPDLAGAGGFADPLKWSQGFTGVDAHATDGLVWHGARPYDPALARFLAPDPLVSGWASTQGHDRYSYVRDRPLNLVDPSGLAPETTYYEFDDEYVSGSLPGGYGPDMDDDVEFAEANETDFLLGSYFEDPDDEVVLEPYELSAGDYAVEAALGFKDAVVDAAEAKAPMLLLAYMATNPVLVVAAPFVAAYQGVETVQAVADDPAGAALGLTPIPAALATYDAIQRGDVREAVRHGTGLTAGVVEGFLGGKSLGGKSCFAAGTPVHTERGLVPIEQLVPGDRLVALDIETGVSELRPITAVIVTPDQPLLRLDLGDDRGSRLQLDVTATHPIWTHMGWTSAGDLAPGDEVLTLSGGWLRVSSGTWIAASTVYNLEVEGLHNYFVGDDGVLVHNGPCARTPRTYDHRQVHTDGSITYTKNHYDVTYRNNRPDFSPYTRSADDDITIELTNNRRADFARANAERGYKRTPDGYTWHHHEDVSMVGGKIRGRMQLVEKSIHNDFPHTGGFAIAKEMFADLE